MASVTGVMPTVGTDVGWAWFGGAWATDHAPMRSKNWFGGSWYLEYAAVWMRNSSSG